MWEMRGIRKVHGSSVIHPVPFLILFIILKYFIVRAKWRWGICDFLKTMCFLQKTDFRGKKGKNRSCEKDRKAVLFG